MLRIEINTGEGGSIEIKWNGFKYMNDCANTIMIMCNSLAQRIGGDKEKAEALMSLVFDDAIKAYRNNDLVVQLSKQTIVKALGEMLAEDTE